MYKKNKKRYCIDEKLNRQAATKCDTLRHFRG